MSAQCKSTGLVGRLRETAWGPNVTDTLIRWSEDRREAADAITRLRGYVEHKPSCGSITVPWEEVGPCDCGLDALIADIEGEG